jgi:hypothetical protein
MAVVWLWLAESLWACPTCKDGLIDPTHTQQILGTAKGYAVSIGLLIGTPFLLIGGIAALVVRQSRRATRQLNRGAGSSPPD